MMEKDNEWISIADKLPNSKVDVLITNGFIKEVGWYCVDLSRWVCDINPTYWQPLPLLPDEIILYRDQGAK